MVKLAHGYANYAPMAGAMTSSGARPFDAAFTNLDYSGGPVMPSNDNFVVVWRPSNYTGTDFQPGTGSQKDYISGVNQFFTDLAHDSATSANSDAVATQYNDTAGETAAYASSYGGTVIDTDPLPANGCPANPGNVCITDAQIQAELESFLSAGGFAADLRHEYFLLTPPDVASCFDASGSECSSNSDSTTPYKYCAYHSRSWADGYVYANIPDLAGVEGCDPWATYFFDGCFLWCSYNNGPADGVLSAISHEHVESITDPEPNNAWTDWGANTGEIGDKCNNDGALDPNLQYGGAGDDAPYNETINGTHYLLQREWSNQTHTCMDAFTSNGSTASASFTETAASGTTMNFDASASTATGGVAEYVWQFNDGTNQGQTQESTSPTYSHPFPAAGTYTVALTVMAHDGTSNGTSLQVVVGGTRQAPTAAFAAPSGPEGTALSFDASASSDPNPGGSITGYAWDFGDGTTASGAKATHTYAKYGTYTATLTVSDNYGLSSTVSHTVTVSDEAPTAAFGASPATAVAGSPVTFDATASNDPDGTITNYSWNFGDSSPAANGATPSHTYAKAGTYTATLTITDSDSQTATISHPVTVAPAQAPTAAFTAPSVREGTALSFDGSASSDPNPGGSITGYAWDFGDGTTGSGVKPTHTYAKHGSYTATLTITNAAGLTNSVSHAVTVTDEPPTASFAAPSGLAKKPLTFVGSGSDPDGTITAYSWNFGDGSPTATGAKPSHTFAKAGTYNVKLTVTDSDGQKATVAHLVKIAVSCVVPRLIGKTLAQAKTALVAANCSLGTVPKSPPKPTTSPGLSKHWALLVGSQSPAAGQVRPKGTPVSVKLVWRAVKN